MATSTIILESNRKNAYAELEKSQLAENNSIFTEKNKFPNHRWDTHIAEGIRIDPGDRVSLEAGMINQVGGGGSVIEFTGLSGLKTEGLSISDNATKMKLAYYVTNNQVFNFNQPKSRIQVNYDFRKNAYGSPAIYADSINTDDSLQGPTDKQNFGAFERSYPYQFIEGSITTFNRATKEYDNTPPGSEPYPEQSDLLPSFSKGGNSVILTSSTKLYVGPKDYLGPFYIDTTTETSPPPESTSGQYFINFGFQHSMESFMKHSFWDYYSTDVLLTQDKGFVNPSSLASNLTNLLHQRDGNASDWNVKDYDAMLIDITGPKENGQLQPYTLTNVPAITDATYKTLPTSTGKTLYQFLHGAEIFKNTGTIGTPEDQVRSWYSEFATADAYPNLGVGYKPFQALMTLYSHELTSRPMYMKGMSRLIQTAQRQPMSEFATNPVAPGEPDWEYFINHYYLHTGKGRLSRQSYFGEIWDIGNIGNHIVIFDNLICKHQPEPFYFYSNTSANARNTVLGADMRFLWPIKGYIIGTNMVWNPELLKLLGEIYSDYYEVVEDTTSTDVNSQEFINAHAIRLNIGRLDDKVSVPADNTKSKITMGINPKQPTTLWKSCYLPTPYNIINNLPDQADPYLGGINQAPYSYRAVATTDTTGNNQQGTQYRGALMGGLWGEENEIMVELIMPKDYTARKAYDGILPNTGLGVADTLWPRDRLLTTSPAILPGMDFELYKYWFWDRIPTLSNGAKLAIVPLFFISEALATTWAGENAANCSYVGYIIRGLPEGHVQNIPLPYFGEFFGFSPSQLTTGSGQLATTQKKLRNLEYPNPGLNNMGGILTEVINTNAGAYGWSVGDFGEVLPSENGATFTISAVYPDNTGINIPSDVDIIDMGANYEVNGIYTCVGTGGDFTIRVVSINTTPNVGGGNADAYKNVEPTIYYPYLNVGAEDSAIVFDNLTSKFAIEKFHTSTTKGNGLFQRASYPINTTDPEQHIVLVNPHSAAICGCQSTGDALVADPQYNPLYFRDVLPVVLGHPTRSAQSGVSILDLSPITNEGLPVKIEQSITININNTSLYDNTLFSKMGYEWEQLCPVYGRPSNDFNRGTYNEYLGFGDGVNLKDKYLNMVKPFTTNAYIDATISFSLSKIVGRTFDPGDNLNTEIFELVPAFNLGGMADKNVGIVNGTSDLLIAKNLARKLAFPYLVVYTNIINNVDYFGGPHGNSKLPAIAYITRNYSTGDFFFSTQSDYSFIADSTYIITKVITDIRLPDGTPAPIDDSSSIIYKIVKGKSMPPTPEEMAEDVKKK